MKKLFVTLVAVIGLEISSFILIPSSDISKDCSECTCSCGATLSYSSQAYQTEKNCWRCGGDGLVTGTCKNCERCGECEGTGKQKCNGWDGEKYTYKRWTNCNDCSYCGGDGLRDVLKSDFTGCTSCGGDSQHAGTGREYTWHSGCKCPRCGKSYTGCN